MKKIFTSLLCSLIGMITFAQWSPTSMQGEKIRPTSNVTLYYSLDLNAIRSKLENAQETGKGATAIELMLPTLNGKIERFAVYSSPVVVKSLADKYDLNSYVGFGIDDPTAYVRFSLSNNDFQSMMLKNGIYEFIEPQNTSKTVYGVHPKTNKSEADRAFACSTNETPLSKKQIDNLYMSGKSFANNPSDFNKSSDKKYRTMRLALSVPGEYTQYFGGVSGALTAINATLTRCNFVFEKDFGLHLILQNFPQLIYTDPNTDPYSPASVGASGANSGNLQGWGLQLQNTLSTTIGSAAYDIGHFFGASGGGGNAGCIGCVCIPPTGENATNLNKAKGSAFTSPADGIPQGDNFDIDYVAHEMGHQLGANHTFSMSLEGTGQNVEPGSGSTIMGYAGITGATDVQPHSDAYFHINSIIQIQNNLTVKNCDIETPIVNNPTVITPMADVTIPKSTAFVLTAQATDPEGDPITYTWEQTDNATTTTNKGNLGTLTSGPNYRSWTGTASPKRYFPKFATVLAGNVTNVNEWEASSTVARVMNFKVTVRDNAPDVTQQQTSFATQKVTVGADGPFQITGNSVYTNAGPLAWNVVNTNNAPYNVANVKIDYSTDGNTWTDIAASTPNNGVANLSFPLPIGSQVYVRIAAIGNVFYTIKKMTVGQIGACDGTAPTNVVVSNVASTSATVSWDPVSGATYTLRYRVAGDVTPWIVVNSNSPSVNLTGLNESTTYEYQVAAICSGTTGTYSQLNTFTTTGLVYCTLTSTNSTDEYISNVTVVAEGGTTMSNNSGASTYTDFSGDTSKLITLYQGSTNNTISVTKKWTSSQYKEAVTVWVDFNRNGIFDASEVIMQTSPDKTTPVTATFPVPGDSYVGNKPLKMRVALRYNAAQTTPCGSYTYGEVEDYAVLIPSSLGVSDITKATSVEVYPNPAIDLLNITKVSSKATYTIFNAAGQLVSKGKVTDGKVQVAELTKGVYVISIDDNGVSSKVKFIKK